MTIWRSWTVPEENDFENKGDGVSACICETFNFKTTPNLTE